MEIIPVLRPSFGEEEIQAVAEVLRSGWAGLGPKTAQFEEDFASYIDSKCVVGTQSGTAALHLILEALGVGPGDEVIVPPVTFVSTVHVVKYVGATPVFADVEEDTLNIDPEDIKRKITDKTKAIIAVHYGGQPCDMDVINELARSKGIFVIEDAAHACGASYKGKKIGSTSDYTCFSFHAVKNLAMGEGGAIACNDETLAKELRKLRWMGISRDTYDRTVNDKVYAWNYTIDKLGYKAHLSDVAAAIGIVQLKKLDANNQKRRLVFQKYTESFKGNSEFVPLAVRDYGESSNHLYVVKFNDPEERDKKIDLLKSRGISPGVHYYPINLQPYYRDEAVKLPVADEIWKRILSLPVFPDLSEEDQSRVIDTMLE